MDENKKHRKHFTRQFKRKVLLEFAKNKKASDILKEFKVEGSDDKKYASKLIHKWKNELYENMNILALIWDNVDEEYAQTEINSIGDDNEEYDIK